VALTYVFLLSLERFVAIRFPFQYHIHSSKSKTILVMVFTFALSVLEIVIAFSFPDEENSWKDGLSRLENHEQCTNLKRFSMFYNTTFKIIVLISLIMTSLLLTIWVGCIARTQRLKHRKLAKHLKNYNETKTHFPEILTIIFLNLIYMMEWIPYCVMLFAAYSKASKETVFIMRAVNEHCLLINSWINAFMYAITRLTYRKAFHFFFTHYPWNWKTLNDKFKENSFTSIFSKNLTSISKKPSDSSFQRKSLKKKYRILTFNTEMQASKTSGDLGNGKRIAFNFKKKSSTLTSSRETSGVQSQVTAGSDSSLNALQNPTAKHKKLNQKLRQKMADVSPLLNNKDPCEYIIDLQCKCRQIYHCGILFNSDQKK